MVLEEVWTTRDLIGGQKMERWCYGLDVNGNVAQDGLRELGGSTHHSIDTIQPNSQHYNFNNLAFYVNSEAFTLVLISLTKTMTKNVRRLPFFTDEN